MLSRMFFAGNKCDKKETWPAESASSLPLPENSSLQIQCHVMDVLNFSEAFSAERRAYGGLLPPPTKPKLPGYIHTPSTSLWLDWQSAWGNCLFGCCKYECCLPQCAPLAACRCRSQLPLSQDCTVSLLRGIMAVVYNLCY
jgi:hypothetical protein